MKSRAIVAAALIAGLALQAPQPSVAAGTMALPNCLGQPQIAPSEVIIACADANFEIEKIQWTGWGSTFAAGLGTASINDCTPYCAAGHFHSYRIVLIASGKQQCGNGQSAYEKITYAFIGKSPYPETDPSTTFKCK